MPFTKTFTVSSLLFCLVFFAPVCEFLQFFVSAWSLAYRDDWEENIITGNTIVRQIPLRLFVFCFVPKCLNRASDVNKNENTGIDRAITLKATDTTFCIINGYGEFQSHTFVIAVS